MMYSVALAIPIATLLLPREVRAMPWSPNPSAPQQVAPLLALATQLLRAGRPDDAIAPLREAALLQPSNPIIQHDLGLACLEVGRVPDAIAALQRAVASNPRYADAYFRLGVALEKLGNIGGAIVAYDRATQLLPSLTEAWFRAGALVYTLGHRDEAIGCFRRAAATGGKTSFGRLGKARALLTEDRNQEAEPVIRRIIAGCGLAWHDACLRPESNPRAVRTPSKWQARQPIYRNSVARWRLYEPWLGPLRALVDDGSELEAGIARS
jgi:tetratricopeptide (TPR) repeat protein